MENIVACCGCICNECPYYQKECGGVPKDTGKTILAGIHRGGAVQYIPVLRGGKETAPLRQMQ